MSDVKDGQALMTEDNLVDTLSEFNEGSSEESSQEEEAQVAEKQSDDNEGAGTTEQPNEEETVEWLIENKFRNDEEGVANLAKSYKEIQGRSQKAENALSEKDSRYEQLDELDTWLGKNPEVVKGLIKEVEHRESLSSPPQKPDDYDILDEAIEGTSSYEWRMKKDEYLVSQGKLEAQKMVNEFKSEMAKQEELRAEYRELRNLGLDDNEIVGYYDFMNDPSNVTNENLVKVYKILKDQHGNSTPETTQTSSGEQKPKRKDKQTSAASVTGASAPAKSSESQEVDEFWGGIMEHSRT